MTRVLKVDPEKCTGCRACELACSVKKEGVSNPSRARIQVIKWESISLQVPLVCQQCEEPLCVRVCPTNAMTRSDALNTPVINYDLCVGCRMCLAVCPFGAIGVDPRNRRTIKCDLCQGDPTCVKFCETKAIDYVEVTSLSREKRREAASRFSELLQQFAHHAGQAHER